MWFWIAIAVGALLGLSLLIGLAVARILGTIGQEISALYETEAWATRPLARDDVHESRASVEETSVDVADGRKDGTARESR